MPVYMVQASYAPQSVASMVKTPQDRAAAIKPMIESMGGKLQDLWFCFGEYDIVAIAEMPDNLTAAAMSMAIGSSGAMTSYRTTPLMTSADAKKAMEKAGGVGYTAPNRWLATLESAEGKSLNELLNRKASPTGT